jgi:hypothetical protein
MVVAILTGHAPVRMHLHTMGLFEGDPTCRFCRKEAETVQHIICHCEVLAHRCFNVFGDLVVKPKDISTASVRDFCLFIRSTRLLILCWMEYLGLHNKPEAEVHLGQLCWQALKRKKKKSTNKTPPHCHLLVVYPAFYLFLYILPRDAQDQFSSNKWGNSSLSCELFNNSIYPCMSGDPTSPTECQVEISFITFWHCCINGEVVLAVGRAFKAACQGKYWRIFGLLYMWISRFQDSICTSSD